ncbi:uncharacterized protein LOC128254045 isoform X3 [Drosophila gunungcola]|uniref:uncharacterized protein LOC128254045 isoform X3 n=1 Tax=Drosophila gunungcola TaxID=103775 RepID=UPI0022E193F7|nr:uncharacterized protein LOC128254045 isoform X3 [Drosophila gunungcola]
MAKAIPDRWLDYKPIGKRVPGTRFIAFKVPLHQHVNAKVKENLRLAPESLLESIPNLGLIIDLTNTNRYYHPSALTNHDVRHQKLMIPGKQTPNKGLAEKFCGFVADFLESNADNANWRTDVGAHTLNQSVIQSSSQPVSQLVFRLASEESPRPELSASREPGKQITYGGARSLVMPRVGKRQFQLCTTACKAICPRAAFHLSFQIQGNCKTHESKLKRNYRRSQIHL